ncbi:sensory neuron membrane protein 1-like [Phymastichus coffea]|uniref:sensory neuron membrane protein 1-like n=1 Tax=Phymastichus coffea TaxID=108790 RepID=UPI00273BA2C0|nr:sensory neuron membrane protein 1-like [Phymastichus coffea]
MALDRVKVFGIAGLFLFIFSIIHHTKIILKSGWPMRKAWSKLPSSFECRAYIFNVTNPKEIANGEKPIVREVGPFVYDVWQEKTQQMDHEEDDTLSYATKKTFYFNSEKSKGLSDDDELTIPHLLSLGTSNGVMKDKAVFLSVASKAIDSVLRNPESVFVKEKVKTLLFDGFEIDCREPEDFFGNAFCSDVKESWQEYRLMKKDENFYTTSVWGTLNATDTELGKSRIHRGMTNMSKIGELVEFNGKKNLSTWKNEYCDAFSGTDGTMFRPFLSEKESVELYVTSAYMCRRLLYHYESKIKFSGMKLLRFTTTMGTDMETNQRDQCFCIAPDRCLKNGVFELFRCLNTPLILSNPHFYLADPYYANSVRGVKPIKEKHETFIDVDPLTGAVINARLRMQYSLFLMKLEKYRLVQNFPEALLPIMWSEEVLELPDIVMKKIKSIHRTITMMKIFEYFMMFGGLAMCGYSGYLEYTKQKANVAVENITSVDSHNNYNGNEKGSALRGSGIGSDTVPPNID